MDRDERAANIAKEHFRDVPADWGAVRQVVADRGQYLENCKDGPFDLVYVDCDKKGYAAVFDVLLDTPGLLSKNACLVFDNTLWKGRVAEGTTGMSPSEEEAILADAELNGDDPKRALKAARERFGSIPAGPKPLESAAGLIAEPAGEQRVTTHWDDSSRRLVMVACSRCPPSASASTVATHDSRSSCQTHAALSPVAPPGRVTSRCVGRGPSS